MQRQYTSTEPDFPPPDARVFLEHFPVNRRSPIANWFHWAVRGGAQSSQRLLQAVRQTCARRQQWGQDTDADAVLKALWSDSAGALPYAQYVIAYEALPAHERHKAKAERAVHYIKQHMTGLPATTAQLAYIRSLGYTGEPPVDRAAASALIDHLLAQRRR